MKVSESSTYLETAALNGKDVTVTIAAVRRPLQSGKDKDVGLDGRPISEKALIISYEGKQKEHVVCRTAQKQIRNLLGSDDTAEWIGKKITLYPTTCKAFGDPNTPCIRVRGKQL